MDKDLFLKKLGARIIEVRTRKGWSQAELARSCFKDRQSIERLENGKINPSSYYLQQIAEGLDLTISELMDF